ncbi:hypothetical protein RRG08_025645 [Elysia crispata]|uniref:Uncharacterized protein n=1 Tax=Elysia crispata TaxID=231223 RepID=A0AAE1CXB6_9GAST|nr:hypothetical protein RRG08_025645 [Elysia crispata]
MIVFASCIVSTIPRPIWSTSSSANSTRMTVHDMETHVSQMLTCHRCWICLCVSDTRLACKVGAARGEQETQPVGNETMVSMVMLVTPAAVRAYQATTEIKENKRIMLAFYFKQERKMRA